MNLAPQTSREESTYWTLLQEGSQSGLEFFYQKYVDDLFSFGMGIVRSEDQVKDAIQEVFLDLWKYRGRLSDSVQVRSYLYKCLAHKIFRLHRKDQKTQQMNWEYTGERESVVESSESKLIQFQVEDHLRESLSQAIAKLPERQRAVINCLFFEEFSYEETSQIMNINLRSTYTLAWKAIASLKKHLFKAMNILFLLAFLG